jgi:hypothetical protein
VKLRQKLNVGRRWPKSFSAGGISRHEKSSAGRPQKVERKPAIGGYSDSGLAARAGGWDSAKMVP